MWAKEPSHKHLYEEIASFEKLAEITHIKNTKREGTKKRIYHYRYMNEIRCFLPVIGVNLDAVEEPLLFVVEFFRVFSPDEPG